MGLLYTDLRLRQRSAVTALHPNWTTESFSWWTPDKKWGNNARTYLKIAHNALRGVKLDA